MKAKKAFLPVVASALLVTMGLAACGKTEPVTPGNNENVPEGEEQKINITAAGNKKELNIDETVQLAADVDGVEWSTKNTDVVTVSSSGLVTAIKDGTARITAKKDGYANGTITITVLKAPEREAKYSLRLEDAEHYDPDDFWGFDLSAYGMGVMGPGDSPVEDNSGATDDGTSLGYLTQGCKETLKFTSNKAVSNIEIGVTMAYNTEMDLGSAISVKLNGVEISMTGRSTVAPEDENNYYEFHAISFGKVNLLQGENVLEIEMIGQGPNMDKVVFFTEETLELATVPATTKEKIAVTNADIKITAEETAQIESATTGLTYVSDNTEVATVSATGLITGVAQGKATITVSKEGMKDAKVTVTVRAKAVAGVIVLEAEDGELSTGAQIENNNEQASGMTHVGYLSEGTSVTIKYTAAVAGEYTLTLRGSSNAGADWSQYPNITTTDCALSEVMTFKLNDNPIDLTGKAVAGGAWGAWNEVVLGDVNLVQGENVFKMEFSAQGPNIDCLKLTDKNGGEVPPAPTSFTVSFDANGGTGTMASVADVSGEYTLPALGFTAPTGKVFAGYKVGNETKQVGDKINVTENVEIKAIWAYTKSADVDLTGAYYCEAEFADLDGGARAEQKANAHGGASLGYMSAGASATFKFDASAAGKAHMVLLAGSATTDGNWWSPTYLDQDIGGTTTMTLNGNPISLANIGINGSEGANFIQIDLGEVDVVAGRNTIVISATAQSANFDAIAFVSDLTLTDPLPDPDPEGMIVLEFESGEYTRPDGTDTTNCFVPESTKKAHGNVGVGYVVAGSKVTFKFNASVEGEVGLVFSGASAKSEWDMSTFSNKIIDQALADCMTIKVNGVAVTLTDKTLPGNNNSDYQNYVDVELGNIAVTSGENIVEVEFSAQGPNLDCLKLQGSDTVVLSLATVSE